MEFQHIAIIRNAMKLLIAGYPMFAADNKHMAGIKDAAYISAVPTRILMADAQNVHATIISHTSQSQITLNG